MNSYLQWAVCIPDVVQKEKNEDTSQATQLIPPDSSAFTISFKKNAEGNETLWGSTNDS